MRDLRGNHARATGTPVASCWSHMRHALQTAALAACAASALSVGMLQAHDPIPSKYTFNGEVSPILNAHCARCHVEGGAAPMPVDAYAKVRPWADAIREQLLQGAMPPLFVDPSGPAVALPRALSARELDMLLTWSAGGAPEGNRSNPVAVPSPPPDWTLGPPDATLVMDAPYTVAANKQDETREFELQTSFGATKWVSAIDLRPGTRSMVRDAQVTDEGGSVLGLWIAGEPALRTPHGTSFRLAAGATLRLRIHYRKSWTDGLVARSDRSSIGLYFTQAPASGQDIRSVAGGRLDALSRVLAVRPMILEPYGLVTVAAIAADGTRTTLLRLRSPQPGWPRRYWLVTPMRLAAGSRILAESSNGDRVDVAIDLIDR